MKKIDEKRDAALMRGIYQPEIEQAALGAMIDNNEVCGMAQVELGLRPEMFFEQVHQMLCQVIFEVAEKNSGYAMAMNVLDRIRKAGHDGWFPDENPFLYIQQLMDLAPVSRLALSNIGIVKNDYLKRQAVAVAREIIEEAYSTEDDGETFLTKVPQRFYDLSQKKEEKRSLAESVDRAVDVWEKIASGDLSMVGLPIGIPRLEKMIGGAQPGLTLIAGRPSAGKTSLEGSVITAMCAEWGLGVGRVMLDMGLDMVVQRELARAGRVSLPKLNSGFATKRNLAAVREAGELVKQWPMYDFHKTDIREVCSWARLMKHRHDIKMLTVDYIQLLTADHLRGADENRVITYNAESLKALSRELKIPVYALSQLSRESEKMKRPPKLTDLRGSGALEQAASQVWFLYKNEEFNLEGRGLSEKVIRPIICDVAKNQNGMTGKMELWFYCSYFLLEDAHEDWKRPTLYERHQRSMEEPEGDNRPVEL